MINALSLICLSIFTLKGSTLTSQPSTLSFPRLIDYHLAAWKQPPHQKPLVIHGPSNVGKTFSVHKLGTAFDTFIEVNFQKDPTLGSLFSTNRSPATIVDDVCAVLGIKRPSGSILLFLDEVQSVPKVLTALPGLSEIPGLHVVASGCRIHAAINEAGVAQEQFTHLHMHPLTFIEFLAAQGFTSLVRVIIDHDSNIQIPHDIHDVLLKQFSEYCAVGGMPEVVKLWIKKRNISQCRILQGILLGNLFLDHTKLIKRHEQKHINQLFAMVPFHLGKTVNNDVFLKTRLLPLLDLLCEERVIHKIPATSHAGTILENDFRMLLFDGGLCQALAGIDPKSWLESPTRAFEEHHKFVAALIGQELLAYTDPIYDPALYYWHRRETGGEAEIDYLAQVDGDIIPIEVKSGKGSTLRSMHMFLEQHPQSPYGIRFSTHNYSIHEKIKSLPLYAVGAVFPRQRDSFESLTEVSS